MITVILSGEQLRVKKICFQGSLQVITLSAKRTLHFSSFLSSQTDELFSRDPEDGGHQLRHGIMEVEDDLGSKDFRNNALNTRTSGML